MAQKVLVGLLLLAAICLQTASANHVAAAGNPLMRALKARREVIVDDNGFYLGGGSNNNLREASQIYDLGGPIVNPWINAFTQPLERIGTAQRLGAFGLGGYAPAAVGAVPGGLGLAGGLGGLGLGLGQVGLATPIAAAAAPAAAPASTNGVDLNLLAQLVAQLAQQQNQQTSIQTIQQQPQQQMVVQQQPQAIPESPKASLQPFTVVFLNNGQPPLFRVGVPTDYPNGYATI
jgi:hypothetical protein